MSGHYHQGRIYVPATTIACVEPTAYNYTCNACGQDRALPPPLKKIIQKMNVNKKCQPLMIFLFRLETYMRGYKR